METNVTNLLSKAIGIEEIIWIDDNFSQTSINEKEKDINIDNIVAQVESILDTNAQDIDLEAILGLNLKQYNNNKGPILKNIKDKLHSNDTNLYLILKQLESKFSEEELTVSAIQNIVNTLNSFFKVVKISLSDWKKKKYELMSKNQNKLFLIDKEFDNEGGTKNDGIMIIEEILRKSIEETQQKDAINSDFPICILFTHKCQDNEEELEKIRKDTYSDLKDSIPDLPSYCVQVLSKSKFADPKKGRTNLIPTLKTLLVRRTLTKMAYSLKNNLNKNINDITDLLINSNIHELEDVIFGSTNKEGVSELELLDRIYHLHQRKVLSELISTTPNIIEDIIKLRNIRESLKNNISTTSSESKSYAEFIAMRRQEVWTNEDIINKIHMPISNGDIFKIGAKEYILIAQPCEIAIRRNGKRKTDIAILAPISRQDNNNIIDKLADKLRSGICYAFSEHAKDNSQWYVEFNFSFYVNINVLDLCTFNEQGEATFSSQSSKPRILDIGGQGKRFEVLLRNLSNTAPQPIPTELKIEVPTIIGKPNKDENFILTFSEEENKWNSNIKRVRRLEDPFAEYVLNKYFLYRSRKAFEHDFTATD